MTRFMYVWAFENYVKTTTNWLSNPNSAANAQMIPSMTPRAELSPESQKQDSRSKRMRLSLGIVDDQSAFVSALSAQDAAAQRLLRGQSESGFQKVY